MVGNDFLITAQHDGWTLAIIRYIVFNLMPRNSPASLPPTEGADLMAFLLASNCYPAGNAPFPTTENPAFAAIKGAVAVMPGLVDRCTVDGETVVPQPGGFYGGWITSRVVGPFKGIPGSMGW